MLRSLYTAATGMEAQQLRMDVIANNLSNASTTGFKKTRAEFEDLLSETLKGAGAPGPRGGGDPAPLQVGLGVHAGSTTRSFGQGDALTTNNPLDLAIQGQGFFKVQQVNGDPAYTRAGNFRLDSTGRLVTQHGEIVEPGITVPPDATQVTIGADGTVTATVAGRTDAATLGQLELASFTNPAGLTSVGNNLFTASAASGEAQSVKPGEQGTGTLAQGMLEGANVKAVEEMIDMIACQRAYELNSKIISTADQMLQRLTNIR
ncbi:flagellar basal-body rod protein FlgG [Anaeromyxobacter diazotrophicus]|uniref:Flagellar basal-body rod protein FlgG n=1 Tax=Anaeromyxobacter diazotrophicus TaxID=2590199 RepID=A0A7I9VRX7_9BACT|nr:flagellar basal-body rod protein FlgG [Anaeromyxobacter diazotrophicus]GEJ59183.1 flagellar basal-body rod protein FlgG [Anaeromyxobacter diazotrophicus]